MAIKKEATHVVEHGRLYLAVRGKLQHMPKGTKLTLDAKQAERYGNKVRLISSGDTVDLTEQPSKEN